MDVVFTTMRCPTDVNDKVKVLAAIKGLSVQDWANTRFRAWVEKEYVREMERESRKSELGNPVG